MHRIPRPVTVRVRDEYHGCHSWVEIDRELPFEGTPVMAEGEFERARQEIASVCDVREPDSSGRIRVSDGRARALLRLRS